MPPRSREAPPDACTQFAIDVSSGSIVAGPHVRAACQRHLDDLEQGTKRGVHFDSQAAELAIAFFPDILRLNGGQFEGNSFSLLPWQAFIIGSLFGWKGDDGYRRFRVAYIETAKGSGKSPLVAGIGLLGLVADNEPRAEIYAAATKKDQAMILFRDAVAMVDQSPILSPRIKKSGTGAGVWNLAFLEAGAFFRPISSDDGQSGPRPHISLLDEVHEHKNGNVIEMLRAGTKSRRQAMICMITNSGSNKHSICYTYHQYAKKIAARQLDDDSFFSFVCSLDKGDEPFRDEDCWPKANPSLQHADIPGYKYIREQVREARGMPSKESVVRRLNFCQWVEAESPWITGEMWDACGDEPVAADLLHGRRCYGGLDLSSTQDLTSLVLIFEPTEDDPVWRMVSWFWLPDDDLPRKAEKDSVPYVEWRQAGFLTTTPGKANNKLLQIRELARLNEIFDIQCVGYDRHRIEDLKIMAEEDGIDITMGVYNKDRELWEYKGDGIRMRSYGQTFEAFGPAVDRFETAMVNLEFRHDNNPVLRWCAANAVVIQRDDNRKISKSKSTGRIDGIVAAAMAWGVSGQKTEAGSGNDGSLI